MKLTFDIYAQVKWIFTYECNDYATPSVSTVSYEGVSHLPLSTEQPPLQIQEHPAQESWATPSSDHGNTPKSVACWMPYWGTNGWPHASLAAEAAHSDLSFAGNLVVCRKNTTSEKERFWIFSFMPFTIPSLNYTIYNILLTCIYWTGITCPSNDCAWTCMPMSPPTKKVTWCWKVHLVYGNLASCHAEKHVASTPASLVEERCPLLIFILLWHYGTNFSTLVLGG